MNLYGVPTLVSYTSYDGSLSIGHPRLEELGSAVRFSCEDSENDRTLPIQAPNKGPIYHVSRDNLDAVIPKLSEVLEPLSPNLRFSKIARILDASFDKYVRMRNAEGSKYQAYDRWRVYIWISITRGENIAAQPNAPVIQASVDGKPHLTGTILIGYSRNKVFQFDALKEQRDAHLPLTEVPPDTIPKPSDLIVRGDDGKLYVCNYETYSNVLGDIPEPENINQLLTHLEWLLNKYQEILPQAKEMFKSIVEWQGPFFRKLAESTAQRMTGGSSSILKLPVKLGNGVVKNVFTAFSDQHNRFSARIKLNYNALQNIHPDAAISRIKGWAKEVNVYEEIYELNKRNVATPGLLVPHEFIRKMKGVMLHVQVLTPIVECSLLDFVNSHKGNLSDQHKSVVFKNVVAAVNSFHTIIKKYHGDIKLENMLIDTRTFTVYLIDFDKCGDPENPGYLLGSLGYNPPEKVNKGGKPNAFAWDAWGTAVVLYSVVKATFPSFALAQFRGDSDDFDLCLEFFHEMQKPEDYTKHIWTLLTTDPEQRMHVTQLHAILKA